MAITAWVSFFNIFKSFTRSRNERTKPSKTEQPPLKEETKLHIASPQPLPVEDIGIENPIHDETEVPDLVSENAEKEEIDIENLLPETIEVPDLVFEKEETEENAVEHLEQETLEVPDAVSETREIEEKITENLIQEVSEAPVLVSEKTDIEEIKTENLVQEVSEVPVLVSEKTDIEEIKTENLVQEVLEVPVLVSEKTDIEEIKTENLVQEVSEISDVVSEPTTPHQPDLVTLEEEMETVEKYLAVEKQRLGEKLDYSLDIEQESLYHKIPPIIIQTLAENAIKHGVLQTSEGGYVHIQSFVYDGFLTIEIKNSGQLKNEDPSVNTPSGSGIYIESTIKRLAQLFGENGFFSIENGSEHEVVATVCVPVSS